MASNSYPRTGYNSGVVTEVEYERLASRQSPDGLYGLPTDSPLVYADGVGTRTVRIRSGRFAWVRGFLYESGSEEIPLTLSANTSGTARIDLVVLRLTRTTMRVQEHVITGTPGAGAPSPVNNTGATGVFDLPLAAVTVAHNANALASGTVSPRAWYVGADGQILCTSTTRPPHERGRRIFETNTNREYVSSGSQWILSAGQVSETVANTTLSGWSIATDSVVTVAGGFVDLRPGSWVRTGGNISSGTDVRLPCTLPSNARHPSRDRRMTFYLSGGRIARITVFSAGHASRSGQMWLTSHTGITTNTEVLGADMSWWLP